MNITEYFPINLFGFKLLPPLPLGNISPSTKLDPEQDNETWPEILTPEHVLENKVDI